MTDARGDVDSSNVGTGEMLRAIPVLSLLLAFGGTASADVTADTDTLNVNSVLSDERLLAERSVEGQLPEDGRPLYYASEVVVVSDRPARFEPFAPEHAVIEGSAGDEIAWAPHVQLGDYGTSAFPAVRGLSREHIGYEYDGVPLNSVQNGLFELTLFDVFDTHATLMRGPFARLATGRSALAAVSMSPSYGAGTSVALASGSKQDAARFSHRGGNVGFRLGFLSEDGFRDKSAVGSLGAEVTARTEQGEGAVTYIRAKRGIPGPAGYEIYAGNQWDELLLARVNLRRMGPARPSAYVVRHEQDYEDQGHEPTHISTAGGAAVEFYMDEMLAPGALVTVAFDYSQIDSSDPLNPDLGRHSRGSGSVVGSYVGSWERLRLGVEGAATHTGDFGTALSGAVGVAAVGSGGRVWLTLGLSNRPPTMNELYWPEDLWSGGNEDLDPESVVTVEAGLEARFKSLTGTVSTYRSTGELIAWTPDSLYVWRPDNVQKARLEGIELEARLDLGPATVSYASAFSTSEDTDTELALPYRPEFSQWVAASIEIGRVTGTYRLRHVGEVTTGDWEFPELDGYTVADFGALVDLPIRGVALQFDILNLMDDRYETRVRYEMPGREWRATLLLGWEDDA